MFRVLLSVRWFRQLSKILGYVSGRIQPVFIHILPVDIVKIEGSHYDSKGGRIIYRLHKRI
uniref:Translation initiation factor 1 n=1 Tax=Zanthoxylum asiaticum TaxID=2839963 RepID=A0A7T0M6P4_9ROSI|nr:translation initiation factor 1 [Zanthoxylum asiaticum]QPL16905.1 translation initiation factor 1 [Zanthoxylum asiaticum]